MLHTHLLQKYFKCTEERNPCGHTHISTHKINKLTRSHFHKIKTIMPVARRISACSNTSSSSTISIDVGSKCCTTTSSCSSEDEFSSSSSESNMKKVKKSLHWSPSLVTNVVHLPIYEVEEDDSDRRYDYYDEFSLLRRRKATTNKLWYKKRDFKLFKQQAKQTVHYIRGEGHNPFTTTSTTHCNSDVEDQHCTRGIEHLVTWETTMIRDHRVQLSRQVVFMEQSFQKVSSNHSSEEDNSDEGDVHVDTAASDNDVDDDGIHASSFSNEEDIARVYKNIAQPLELVAYQRGLEDAREAKLIQLEQDNHHGSRDQRSATYFDDGIEDHHMLDGEQFDEYKDGYERHHNDINAQQNDNIVGSIDMEPIPFEVSSSSDDSEEGDVDEDVLDSTSLRSFFRFDFEEQTSNNDNDTTICSGLVAAASNDDTPKDHHQHQKPWTKVIASLTTEKTTAPDTPTTTTFPDFPATKSKRYRIDVNIRDDLEDFPTRQAKRMKKSMPIL